MLTYSEINRVQVGDVLVATPGNGALNFSTGRVVEVGRFFWRKETFDGLAKVRVLVARPNGATMSGTISEGDALTIA